MRYESDIPKMLHASISQCRGVENCEIDDSMPNRLIVRVEFDPDDTYNAHKMHISDRVISICRYKDLDPVMDSLFLTDQWMELICEY